MTNFTFYKLLDPRTQEVKYIDYTKGRLPELLDFLKSDALNVKKKSERDLWILELMDLNKSPLLENLGQKQLNDVFNADQHLYTLREPFGLNPIKEEKVEEKVKPATKKRTTKKKK